MKKKYLWYPNLSEQLDGGESRHHENVEKQQPALAILILLDELLFK